MSLFSSLFGLSAKYSKEEHYLSEVEIKKLVSHSKVISIDSRDEGLIESAIKARRRGDGKISLQQIYEVLTQLKNQNKINQYDREGLMKVFTEHFQK